MYNFAENMGGKKSGYDDFTNNAKAQQLLECYRTGQIKTQQELHEQMQAADIKISFRTMKAFLSKAQIRMKRGRKGLPKMEQGMERETSMDLELEDSFETDHNEIEMQVEEVANGSSFSNAEALMENIKLSVALALGLEAGGEDQHDHEQNYQAETNDGMTSNSLDPLASIIQANHNGLQLQVNDLTMGMEEQLLNAAIEWIMTEHNALGVLGSDGFKRFFDRAFQIQLEQFMQGNTRPLLLPNKNNINAALDMHLAKIEEDQKILSSKKSQIETLKEALAAKRTT